MIKKTYIALMRGINVGGKNKLPMTDLKRIFEDIGCEAVETYIQSGNVIFDAKRAIATRVETQAAAEIERRHGLTVPVISRAAADLARIVKGNPFQHESADPKTLHVGFLKDTPTVDQLSHLDKDRSPPDAFQVIDQEIYLFCPNGLARTKLTTDYFDRTLSTVTTVRNWNTVTMLLRLSTRT